MQNISYKKRGYFEYIDSNSPLSFYNPLFIKHSFKLFERLVIKVKYSSFPGVKLNPIGSNSPSLACVSVITVWTILDGNCGSLNRQTTLSFLILALISVILFGVGEISGFSAIGFYQIYKRLRSKKIAAFVGYAIFISIVFVVMPDNPDEITAPMEIVNGFRIFSRDSGMGIVE